MALVFTCTPGNEATTTANRGVGQTGPIPECANGGVWVEHQTLYEASANFTIAQLDPTTIASALGAGMVVAGVIWVLGRSVGAILNLIGK